MPLIDPDLAEVLTAYRTCEFATLGRDGTPLAWPTATHLWPDGKLLVTTSLAFAQKALNVRRDGRVAMLFSDPTGSGRRYPPQVFISGYAHCPDEIVTSPAGLEGFWARLFERQPQSKRYIKSPFNLLMDWYFMRLLITIEPESVVVRSPIATGATSSGLTGLPDGAAPLGTGLLSRFPTAVLGAVDAVGAPLLVRTTVTPVERGFEVRGEDAAVAAGPASLLVHRHGEKLSGRYNALVHGRLSELGRGKWLLVPDRMVEPGGSGRPADQARLLKQTGRATARYLARRDLARPRVPWDEYRKLAADV